MRNPDEDLRRLGRAVREGVPGAYAKLQREKARRGLGTARGASRLYRSARSLSTGVACGHMDPSPVVIEDATGRHLVCRSCAERYAGCVGIERPCGQTVAGLDPWSGSPVCREHLARLTREWNLHLADQRRGRMFNPDIDVRSLERAFLTGDLHAGDQILALAQRLPSSAFTPGILDRAILARYEALAIAAEGAPFFPEGFMRSVHEAGMRFPGHRRTGVGSVMVGDDAVVVKGAHRGRRGPLVGRKGTRKFALGAPIPRGHRAEIVDELVRVKRQRETVGAPTIGVYDYQVVRLPQRMEQRLVAGAEAMIERIRAGDLGAAEDFVRLCQKRPGCPVHFLAEAGQAFLGSFPHARHETAIWPGVVSGQQRIDNAWTHIRWLIDAASRESAATNPTITVSDLGRADSLAWALTSKGYRAEIRPAGDLYEVVTDAPRAVLDPIVNRVARNPDEDLRDLERRALGGDRDAARRLRSHLLRTGQPITETARGDFTNPEIVLLCALRFWSHSSTTGMFSRSLQKAVRSVARRQGVTVADLNRATKSLLDRGLVSTGGQRSGRWLELTDAGIEASEACYGVELTPWNWRKSFPRVTTRDFSTAEVERAAIELRRAVGDVPVGDQRGGNMDPRLDRIRELMSAWQRTPDGEPSGLGPEGTPSREFMHFLYDMWLGATVEEAEAAHPARLRGARNPARRVSVVSARRHAHARGELAVLDAQLLAYKHEHGRLPAEVTIT